MSHHDSRIVTKDAHLTLHYRVGSKAGYDIVNTFNERPATFQLGTGQLAPTLETCLIGLTEDVHRVFELSAQEAFGSRNADLVHYVSATLLKAHTQGDKEHQVGDWVHLLVPGKGNVTGMVCEKDASGAWLDFNHPLAGQEIEFEVHIIGIL